MLVVKAKQIGKDSLIYGLGDGLAKGIGFFLLPVYTRIFSVSDYGTLEMLVQISSFLGILIVLGMNGSQGFYFYEQEGRGRSAQAKVITAALQWRLIWGSACVVLAMLFAPLLNELFFRGEITWYFFVVAFSAALFSQLMSQSAEVFRLLYKPVKYLSITLVHSLGTATVGLTLIVVFKQGIVGFFLGSLFASIAAAIWGWWLIRGYIDWSAWHRDWWLRLLKFGAPLAPAGFAMYILNASDRWFIVSFRGPNELGLYTVGAKFAVMMALAVQSFRLAWWPVAMNCMQREEGKPLFRAMGRLYMGVGVACVVLLTAIAPLLVRVMAAPEYFYAYPVIGVLAWYPVFYGFYLIGSCGMWKAEKTAWAPLLMGVAAVMNIGLNAWWVPLYGGMGAAAATAISFFIWNMLSLYVSERLWKVGYAYFIMLGQVIVGALACAMILYIYQIQINYLNGISIATATMLLLGLSAFSRDHIKKAGLILMSWRY